MIVALKELGDIYTGNTPSKKINEYYDSNDIYFVKPDIISDSEVSIISNSSEYISEKARDKARIAPQNSIFVTCIGTIGKIGIASDGEFAFNQQINTIKPNDSTIPKYLAYNLFYSKSRLKAISNAPVVPIINKSQFSEFTINIETDKLKQQKIVSTLDKLQSIITHRRTQLEKLDLLVKARFVEMFGDVVKNNKQWNCFALCNVSDIVSGITKGRKIKETKLIEVPYMAVSNVKDGYIDFSTLKTIFATPSEIERYRIIPEDILMTEGGDPDKLGRGAIIYQIPQNCIHQNHIFRVRLKDSILPLYFSEYLKTQKTKRYFLECAKQTTGIASINMKQLKALPVLVPPLDLQIQFADFVKQVDQSKSILQQELDKAQTLFDSLMQEYFG